jgi:uncharacterized damage-inducible protein DinB
MPKEEIFATVAVSSWKQVIDRLDKMFSSIRDEELKQQVAPGRNRTFYLLGHLTAVHDRMFTLLGVGERLHPELDAPFLENPDKPVANEISPADLRKAWSEVNNKLTAAFESLKPEQWLERHTAVSEQDFAKEPLRNRLAVLMSRTNHASFHMGQVRLTRES